MRSSQLGRGASNEGPGQKTQTREGPRGDGGRGRSDVAASQGRLDPQELERLEGPSPEAPEGAQPCDSLAPELGENRFLSF